VKISQNAKDGMMKSSFNQQPAMLEMLEDRNKTVSGLYREWNRISPAYRQNYDTIKWDGGPSNG
jgi:hypothetical protein